MTTTTLETEEQLVALKELSEQHSRLTWRTIDAVGRIQVDTDCDETGEPTSSYIIEPDGRIHGV